MITLIIVFVFVIVGILLFLNKSGSRKNVQLAPEPVDVVIKSHVPALAVPPGEPNSNNPDIAIEKIYSVPLATSQPILQEEIEIQLPEIFAEANKVFFTEKIKPVESVEIVSPEPDQIVSKLLEILHEPQRHSGNESKEGLTSPSFSSNDEFPEKPETSTKIDSEAPVDAATTGVNQLSAHYTPNITSPNSDRTSQPHKSFNKEVTPKTFEHYQSLRLKSLQELKALEAKQANKIIANTESENPVSDWNLENRFPIKPEPPFLDDSIIDIAEGNYNLAIDVDISEYLTVPTWRHQYVYAYTEIYRANELQQGFYKEFKEKFLNGVYLDLQGNTNYAFVLLLHLLNDYEVHGAVSLLERQLEELGTHYQVTRGYAIGFLIKKYEGLSDLESVARLRDKYAQYVLYNYENAWHLGTKYKQELQLSNEDIELINQFDYFGNNFSDIAFCCKNTIRLFLKVVETLKQTPCSLDLSDNDVLTHILGEISTKHYKHTSEGYNYSYYLNSLKSDVYLNIFRHCENGLRNYYNHKRNINAEVFYIPEIRNLYEMTIVAKLKEILPGILATLPQLDIETEIELNRQNTTRWKAKFESLKESTCVNPAGFLENIKMLANKNCKNPSVECIYFEASKFISKLDKQMALSLYIHYLDADLKSSAFDNKKLTKTIQKSLFNNNEQLHEFESIVAQLISDRDLEKSLRLVGEMYRFKRKKISLDAKSITAVQQQHSDTVKVLNEYLQDEFEDQTNVISSKQINADEIEIQILPKTDTSRLPTYISIIQTNDTHVELLDFFAKSNHTLLQTVVEEFAKSKGIFKNQLVDNINENCFELLDDVLIEEEDAFYIINPPYYQTLLINAG